MPTILIEDKDDPRLADYHNVPDPVLVRSRGLFVVEGRLVVRRFLASSRLAARSVLVTAPALGTLADVIAARPSVPVFVVPQAVMNTVSGFHVHRGCLAVGERSAPVPLRDLLGDADPRRMVVLEGVSNADNVGGIFRSATALGGDAVLLGPGCCDPLYRKAIRTSIGTTLTLPYAATEHWPGSLAELKAAGFTIAALTPSATAVTIDDAARHIRTHARVALLLGAEGTGLTALAVEASDLQVRIPIAPDVDSLNVAVAASIALHRLSP